MKFTNIRYGLWICEAEDGEVLDTITGNFYTCTFLVKSTGKEYTSLEAAKKVVVKKHATEPIHPIYYMRDNHTFRKLSESVPAALVEIEQEFNEGYTYGSLFSKREGFPMVHANGSKNRVEFLEECERVLKEWI